MSFQADKPSVRQAIESDIPFILSCIKELAIYEKEPDAVEATEQSLLATIALEGRQTSATRPARCLVCIDTTGTPQAIALYFYNYSTWTSKAGIYLEDLYVREEARNRGYGQLLLGQLAKEVVDMGGRRLDWSVLKWNTPSIEFYQRLDAIIMEDWVGCRMEGEALKRLAKKAL